MLETSQSFSFFSNTISPPPPLHTQVILETSLETALDPSLYRSCIGYTSGQTTNGFNRFSSLYPWPLTMFNESTGY